MDKLKKYLKEQETGMDVDFPDQNVWHRIESHTLPKSARSRVVWLITRYVAAACIIGGVGFSIWVFLLKDHKKPAPSDKIVKTVIPVKKDSLLNQDTNNNIHHQEIAELKPPVSNKQQDIHRSMRSPKPDIKTDPLITDEVTMISKSYTQLINSQLNKLRSTPVYAESPDYFKLFVEQLQQMETDELIIRNDIKQYGLTDELLEQLINVYQQKLNVLKVLRVEINKMNNRVKEKQGPSEIGNPYHLNL